MIGVILVLLTTVLLGVMPNSLNIIAIAGILSLISYKNRDFFKHASVFYVLALILSILGVVFYKESWTYLITKGILGYGFIFVVMMVGVLPNKWTLTRNIKKSRGVFSIMGFILISPHALLRVLGLMGYINLFGIAAYVIMVPLTIISFRIIRKEIDPKDWFNIQKAAYGVYGVLFVHLLLVAGNLDKIVYAVLITLYINNKLLKEIKR